ncbi:M15 family metallopeptidase [Eubacteriales bacterium OttesenSCG-928-N14]|nr:M15 family metallopeptidase [Eubacteriales bacterium OttesenSCG-928-N14]
MPPKRDDYRQLQRGKNSRKRRGVRVANPTRLIVMGLLVLLVIAAIVIGCILLFGGSGDTPSPTPTPEVSTPVNPTDTTAPTPTPTIPADEAWMLILANADNPLPDGFAPQTAKAQGNYLMDARAVQPMQQMIAAAKADGVTLNLTSAYRTKEYQQGLFDNKVQRLMNVGKTREQAEAEAATVVALPGTSEHQTGLAVDIITPSYTTLDEGFANTDAFAWLQAHAAEYGFVLRYAKEKQDITGIIYEPWHYRYVGIEHAARMNENNWCLEEYLQNYYGQTIK